MRNASAKPLRFPAVWMSAGAVDELFRTITADERSGGLSVAVVKDCKLLLDGVVRLLAISNHLAGQGVPIRIDFEDGPVGAMGYLDRIGFFERLVDGVEVQPDPPWRSGATTFRGGNCGLVELERICRDESDRGLPDRLAGKLIHACRDRADVQQIGEATATIFSELVSNVQEHSGSGRDGVAALQVYRGGNKVKVVVSDNGDGLMSTLRPELARRTDRYLHTSDVDLLIEMFREGLSRSERPGRGLGLKACAAKAIRFGAELEVRLSTQSVRLSPSPTGYSRTSAFTRVGLIPLAGTHIAFSFGLT